MQKLIFREQYACAFVFLRMPVQKESNGKDGRHMDRQESERGGEKEIERGRKKRKNR